jgi:hypothetical protein
MAFAHGFQGSRFELKYLLSEACARAVRDFSLSYLEPDPHADPAKNCEYPVHSLYLDNSSLALCRATMHGEKNRFKLRIRFYDDSPESPAFLEIKRRQNDVILKQRAPVRRASIGRILNGHWPAPADVMDSSPRGLAAVSQFCRLRTMIQAEGQVFVSYVREAYVTPNTDSARLTFDRRLQGVRYERGGSLVRTGLVVHPDVAGVILELKFTDRFPIWMRQMVREFNLVRRSMPKYVTCVLALKMPQLQLV